MAKATPASLDGSLLGVPKGAAAPAELASVTILDEEPKVNRRATLAPVPPPIEEPRKALTVRLPLETHERLRAAVYATRREKQDIVAEALLLWLEERGF